jgi:RND family efflux transporter MFP subunit
MFQLSQPAFEPVNLLRDKARQSVSRHRSRRDLLLGCSQNRWSAAVAGLTIIAVLVGCSKKTETPVLPPVTVTIATPIEREIVNYEEFTGNTAAVDSVDIRARVSGYLAKIGFSEGAMVKTGEVLFIIDQRPYQAALDQAQANLEQAKAQLQLAQSNYERSDRLHKTGVIDQQQYETDFANRNAANASVLANQAALETAQLNFAFTEVRSPIDGQTSTYKYTIGNLIAAGDTTSTGVLTSVVSVDPVYVYVNVDERALLTYQEMVRTGKIQLTEGSKTPMEMQLANENTYPHVGYIDFVDNQVDPSTGTIRVRGVFPNKDRILRPGLFARVRIPSGPKFKALLISDLAIGYDQGQPIVYVIDERNLAKAKPVKLGAISDGLRVVESGITPDDRIVVNGIVRIRPGIQVTPEQGNMADFTGTLRRAVAVEPTRETSGEKGPDQSKQKTPSPPPTDKH